MTADTFQPAQAVLKELDIRFAMMYTPQEFAETFAHLAAGDFDVAPLLSGTVGMDQVADVFDRLANSPSDAKIRARPNTVIAGPAEVNPQPQTQKRNIHMSTTLETTPQQITALTARPADAPVLMVNLLKFKQPGGLAPIPAARAGSGPAPRACRWDCPLRGRRPRPSSSVTASGLGGTPFSSLSTRHRPHSSTW